MTTTDLAGVGDLDSAVTHAARRWPYRVAWTYPGIERVTFVDVERRSSGYAHVLRRRGVQEGDRVALMLGNRPEFPLLWLALARLGATAVPLNTKYGAADTAHVLRHSGASLVIAETGHLPALSDVTDVRVVDARTLRPEIGFVARPVPAESTANVQYTSGTTGLPKGCLLSHAYWIRLAASLVDQFPRIGRDDVVLTAQPFHYIDPQWNIVLGLLSGAEVVVLDGFHPSTFWESVREHEVTYFYCLGAMPGLLHKMPPDPRDRDNRVRVVQCSGIPPALHHELEQRWGVAWFEAFGMTETGADLRVTDADHDELVGSGCVGGPLPDREVRVVDGELRLRGPGMMTGYLDDPAANAVAYEDGWFRTGDLARIDGDGRVYLVGRTKDMIRRGGENVAAREVEDVLLTHPGVRLAAVTAVPDDLRGEEVKAHIVGVRDPEALAAHCATRLASFKVPRYWEFRDQLPTTPSERVAKHRLAEQSGSTYDRVSGEWTT